MTLAIGWPHEGGENPREWPHEGGDWHVEAILTDKAVNPGIELSASFSCCAMCTPLRTSRRTRPNSDFAMVDLLVTRRGSRCAWRQFYFEPYGVARDVDRRLREASRASARKEIEIYSKDIRLLYRT